MNMRSFFLLFPLLVALPGHAAPEAMMADARLDQQITVTGVATLTAVLDRLAKDAGVKLIVDTPMAQMAITCRYRGTLRGYMDALAQFFAVDAGHAATWADADQHGYVLTRSAGADIALDTLRREREFELARAMELAVKTAGPHAKMFSALPEVERLHVYRGGAITRTAVELGGRAALDGLLGDNNSSWGQKLTVEFAMVGKSPMSRCFQWTLRESNDDDHPVQELIEGARVSQMCSELAPARQQAKWRERYDDPTVPIGARVRHPWNARSDATLPRHLVLDQLAAGAAVNMIADADEYPLRYDTFPKDASLSTMLDLACAPSFVPLKDGPANDPGSFWRKCGDVYLVRSLAWPEEEQ